MTAPDGAAGDAGDAHPLDPDHPNAGDPVADPAWRRITEYEPDLPVPPDHDEQPGG
jgi:hypothetical protein